MLQAHLYLFSVFTSVLLCGALSSADDEAPQGHRLHDQRLAAMIRLLSGLHDGVYPTCNFVLFSQLATFSEADYHCTSFDIGTGRRESGHLATVNTTDKNEDMKNLLQTAFPAVNNESFWAATNWVWSGLRKVNNTDGQGMVGKNKYKVVYSPEDWEWADGTTPAGFEMWRRGGKSNQPDQKNKRYGVGGCYKKPFCRQNYMRINREGQWDDAFKFERHPYVCDYQGKYILSPEKVDWHQANRMCTQAGLHLAKIENMADVGELKSAMIHLLGEADPSWKVFDQNNWIWVGGTDWAFEGIWRWTDGTLIETWEMPWIEKAGNDNANNKKGFKKIGQDVLAFSRNGLFDDSYEKTVHRGFACQCPGK